MENANKNTNDSVLNNYVNTTTDSIWYENICQIQTQILLCSVKVYSNTELFAHLCSCLIFLALLGEPHAKKNRVYLGIAHRIRVSSGHLDVLKPILCRKFQIVGAGGVVQGARGAGQGPLFRCLRMGSTLISDDGFNGNKFLLV